MANKGQHQQSSTKNNSIPTQDVKTEKPVEEVKEPVREEYVDTSVYSISDLSEMEVARNTFGTMPECVEAALKIAGKESYTVQEAKTIVKAFLEKEVK